MASETPNANKYTGNVLRDSIFGINAETGGAVTGVTTYRTAAQMATLAAAGSAVKMGAADALLIGFAGTGADNTTGNYRIHACYPIVTSASNSTIVGYFLVVRSIGTFTLCTTTASATLDNVAGLSTSDRFADTIAETTTGVASLQSIFSPVGEFGAAFYVKALGAAYIFVDAGVGTATTVLSFGCRMQGDAQTIGST